MKSLKRLFATRPLPVAIANDPKYQLLLQGHDDTIQRYVGASSLVALVVASYISTFNFVIDEPFFVEAKTPSAVGARRQIWLLCTAPLQLMH